MTGTDKLKFNVRQLVVLYLIGWAIKVAPSGEGRLLFNLLKANDSVRMFEEPRK